MTATLHPQVQSPNLGATRPDIDIQQGIPARPDKLLDILSKARRTYKLYQGNNRTSTPIDSTQNSVDSSITGSVSDTEPGNIAIIPRSILERLQNPLRSSSLKIHLRDEVVFNCEAYKIKCEQELDHFVQYVDSHSTVLFRGQTKPTLHFELVSLQGNARYEQHPWIRIRGFLEQHDMIHFHKLLSTKQARKKYEHLGLCYEPSPIMRGSSNETAKALLHPSSTLCGYHILNECDSSAERWLSTMGGVIEIDGEFFSLSTAHRTEDRHENRLERLQGDQDEAMEDNFSPDVHSALILDHLEVQHQYSNLANGYGVPNHSNDDILPLGPLVAENIKTSDWRLQSIMTSSLRPNLATTYIGRYAASAQKQAVIVLAASTDTRLVRGHLQIGEGYIKIGPSFSSLKCWSVKLEGASSTYVGVAI